MGLGVEVGVGNGVEVAVGVAVLVAVGVGVRVGVGVGEGEVVGVGVGVGEGAAVGVGVGVLVDVGVGNGVGVVVEVEVAVCTGVAVGVADGVEVGVNVVVGDGDSVGADVAVAVVTACAVAEGGGSPGAARPTCGAGAPSGAGDGETAARPAVVAGGVGGVPGAEVAGPAELRGATALPAEPLTASPGRPVSSDRQPLANSPMANAMIAPASLTHRERSGLIPDLGAVMAAVALMRVALMGGKADAFQPVWRTAWFIGLTKCQVVRGVALKHQVSAQPGREHVMAAKPYHSRAVGHARWPAVHRALCLCDLRTAARFANSPGLHAAVVNRQDEPPPRYQALTR